MAWRLFFIAAALYNAAAGLPLLVEIGRAHV